MAGMVYEDDVLQFVGDEEGRIRYKPAIGTAVADFVYDYFIKDQLGNVRMVLTEEQQQDKYPLASLEPSKIATEKNYYDIKDAQVVDKSAATGITDYLNDNNGIGNNPSDPTFSASNSTKLYKLKSTEAKTGLGITLKVMAGDKIDVFGKSYYFENTSGTAGNSTVPIADLLAAFLGAPNAAGTTGLHGAVNPADINTTSGMAGINSMINQQNNQSNAASTKPRAFINVIFFDEQFKTEDGGFKISMVGDNSIVKTHTDLQNLIAGKNGYVYIYCSNESPVSVFFDNIQVVHTRGAILEETHYYPFGLTMAGVSSKAAGSIINKAKYNGKELQSQEFSDGTGLEEYDYGARMFDPQIGRWNGNDPKAEAYTGLSPYNYCLNNPIKYIDPNGEDVYLIIWGTADGEIGHAGIAVDNYKSEKYKVKEKYKDSDGKTKTRKVEKERQVKDGTVTYYDLWPGNEGGVGVKNFNKDINARYNSKVTTLDALKNTDITHSEGRAPDGVIQLRTDGVTQDRQTQDKLKAFKDINPSYNGLKCNCSTYASEGVMGGAPPSIGAYYFSEQIGSQWAVTPNQLYKFTATLPNATIVKDAGTKVEKKFVDGVTGGGINGTAAKLKVD